MVFQQGQSGNPEGRVKGSKNKFTLVKEAIVEVFEAKGGKDSLIRAIKNDRDFYKFIKDIVLPILPRDPLVKVENTEQNITIQWKNQNEEMQDVPERIRTESLAGEETQEIRE